MTLVSIQVLRATAALLVLAAHLWTPFARLGKPDLFPNFIAGAAGVDLFFVISGFVMVYSSERFFGKPGGSIQFFLHRLARIVPLYWVASTLALTLCLGLRNPPVVDLTVASVVASYFFFPYPNLSGSYQPVHDVGWTLNFEMFFYVIFAVAVILPRRKAVACAIIALALLMLASRMNLLPQPLHYLSAPFLWEFIYGMAIGIAYRSGIRLPTPAVLLLVTTGVCFYIWTCTLEITGEVASWRHIIWGGSGALVVAGLTLSTIRGSRNVLWAAIALVGDASYALYLTHSIVLEVMGVKFGGLLRAATHPYVYVCMELTVSISAAILIHLYFEKPTTKALRSRITRLPILRVAA